MSPADLNQNICVEVAETLNFTQLQLEIGIRPLIFLHCSSTFSASAEQNIDCIAAEFGLVESIG